VAVVARTCNLTPNALGFGANELKNCCRTWTRVHTGSYGSLTLKPAAPRIAYAEVSADCARQGFLPSWEAPVHRWRNMSRRAPSQASRYQPHRRYRHRLKINESQERCHVPRFLLLIPQEMAGEMDLHPRTKACLDKCSTVQIVQVLLIVGRVRGLKAVKDTSVTQI
jgi:hypothetical protein